MAANRLKLNHAKTEVLWCSWSCRQHQIPAGPVRIGDTDVLPVRSVRVWSIHWRRRDHEGPCHHRRPILFSRSVPNQKHAACTCTSRRTDMVRALIVNWFLAGMSVQLHDQLQSLRNAAARLIFTARRPDRISPLLRDLHWLRVPEHVKFKLCVLVYRCLHGTAPPYLADDLPLTSANGNRCLLRSAVSPTLVVKPTRRSTLGDRAFRVAAARAWNSLPPAVSDAPSFLSLRSRLKAWLFELTL